MSAAAEVAYEAHRHYLNGLTPGVEHVPPWSAVVPEFREAWEAAVRDLLTGDLTWLDPWIDVTVKDSARRLNFIRHTRILLARMEELHAMGDE